MVTLKREKKILYKKLLKTEVHLIDPVDCFS